MHLPKRANPAFSAVLARFPEGISPLRDFLMPYAVTETSQVSLNVDSPAV